VFCQIAPGGSVIAGTVAVASASPKQAVTISGNPGVPLGASDVYTVSFSGQPVTLVLSTLKGTSGSATFDDGTTVKTLSQSGTVTVVGVGVSSTADNILLVAQPSQAAGVLAFMQFSVATVTLSLRTSGYGQDPAELAIDDGARPAYLAGTGQYNLGPLVNSLYQCAVGVEIVGVVNPTNYRGSIYFQRALTGGALYKNSTQLEESVSIQADHYLAAGQDNDPQSGGSRGRVYDIDDPGIGTVFPGINRFRQNFREYAVLNSISNGVAVSNVLLWWSASSCQLVGSNVTFATDVLNDNTAGTGTIITSWDLKAHLLKERIYYG
jgi:hypothetical protein